MTWIPPERGDELFKKFSRLAAKANGSGLGVYLSRLIALAYDGDLTLRASGSTDGCRFALTLPIHSATAEGTLPPKSVIVLGREARTAG